jgi:hypothetical protein
MCYNKGTKQRKEKSKMTTTTIFMARFETTSSLGCAAFETENEMYVTLEFDRLTEDNSAVIGIDYYELRQLPNGHSEMVRRWDFGKPRLNDYWRKIA